VTNYIRFTKLREDYVPVSKYCIWNWVRQGLFPAPIQLNPGVVNSPVVWPESEVLEWLASRPRGFGRHHPTVTQARRRKAIECRLGRSVILGPTRGGMVRLAPLPPASHEAGDTTDRAWTANWAERRPR
jgi:predicted DNA-binding transcriptional regulator AlpA